MDKMAEVCWFLVGQQEWLKVKVESGWLVGWLGLMV